MVINPQAGKAPKPSSLVNVPKLITSYYTEVPDLKYPEEKVSFGTSGHRGSSFKKSFNENHILAITQAICDFRELHKIDGPLFLGKDTHALSEPSFATALEVLAANGVHVFLPKKGEYTPTPVISHAILSYNKGKKEHLADGIVITPSHNPPKEGGFKYNPPSGGPADTITTQWIEDRANAFLKEDLKGIKRISFEKALKASTTKKYDYLDTYVKDLANVIDMELIRNANLSLAVDPLGGAGIAFWPLIRDHFGLNLTIVNETIDPTFRFMTLDWDGQIRMDPSSSYAMKGLISLKDRFDLAFACDTDHDRHGIVTKSHGLLPSNHYLAVAIDYLFTNRPKWPSHAKIGKTIVSSQMIDKVANRLGRQVFEVPVGFKWFVEGLLNGSLAFVGEESAGGTFLRFNGSCWTTDKDGILLSLLAAEILAKRQKDPGEIFEDLTHSFGKSFYQRIDVAATPKQKQQLKNLSSEDIPFKELGSEPIISILTKAPGNLAPIGGVKVIAKSGWFALRPSGTEDTYKIYAESFLGKEHLNKIIEQAYAVAAS